MPLLLGSARRRAPPAASPYMVRKDTLLHRGAIGIPGDVYEHVFSHNYESGKRRFLVQTRSLCRAAVVCALGE